MKKLFFLGVAVFPLMVAAQLAVKTENVFIITTDGFRWQEVFSGADPSLISNACCNADTVFTKSMYWDDVDSIRRKKLLPFFWNVIAKMGQLYGNRVFGNKVDVKNLYKISYPGYNELLTGYADPYFIPNRPVNNRNQNILEKINQLPAYKGKVIAFTSWSVFPYILNQERSKLPVNSGYEPLREGTDSTNQLINIVQASVRDKNNTRHDWLTYLSAKEYALYHHPKVMFLALGETDEAAHDNRYDRYLQSAANFDRMIADLWYAIQTDPVYKDKTTFIITTDHGRGDTEQSWHTHGFWAKHSGQTWLAIVGPDTVSPIGTISTDGQLYSNQVAATIAMLLGEKFETSRKTGKPIQLAAPTLKPALARAP